MAHRYLDETARGAVGDRLRLSGAEARHAVTVSRMGVGERISVGDGRGAVFSGEIVAAEREFVEFTVDGVETIAPRRPRITLVQALAKGDRDEMAIQAATELGVDRVIPWSASRSVSRWDGPKIAKGVQRWTTIVREASKQSLRAWVPAVGDLTTTRQLAALTSGARMLLLEPTADVTLMQATTNADAEEFVLVVGPEGGIAPAELDALIAAGAISVRLGPEVLRTSTAGPAAVAILSAALRWS